jgi:hypothetical protein
MKCSIIFLLFTVPLSAQSFLKNIYFAFDAKNKWELYTIPVRQEFVEIEPYSNNYAFLDSEGAYWDDMVKYCIIGYRINPKLEVEIGTTRETYWGGFKYNSPDFPFDENAWGQSVDNARNYTFRLTRKFFPLKKLSINASLAYTLSKSEYWDGFIVIGNGFNFPYRSDIDTTKVLHVIQHEEHRVDLGLRKYFHSVDGRLTIEYQPFKQFSIYYGWGYTQGFNVFAKERVTYWVNNEPKKTSIALINGSNYYWTFGFKVYPFELGIIKGMKKAVERSNAKTKQQREAKAQQQKKKH